MIRDPRVRRTLNELSDNFESYADTAKTGCFTFTKSYLEPCFTSIASICPSEADLQGACPCCYSELPSSRRRRRGPLEYDFEFYNSDYEESAPEDPLRWGNDELDRLLAGSGSGRRKRAGSRNDGMHYTRSGQRRTSTQPTRRKSALLSHDGGPDPTIIPNTSALGFLSYFTWVKKRQALRYKPSAADLQDHPGGYGGVGGEFREGGSSDDGEFEALLGGEQASVGGDGARKGRNRSGTTSSGDTTDTFRSRADLFPSEDEDDAVPLDDEFDLPFDADSGSGGGRKGKRGLRRTRTGDTSSGRSGKNSMDSPARSAGRKTPLSEEHRVEDDIDLDARELSLGDDEDFNYVIGRSDDELKREEDEARKEEEQAIDLRRQAAKRLALKRGLSAEEGPSSPLLDTADRAVPMFESIVSPILMPAADEIAPEPIALHSKESQEYLSDPAIEILDDVDFPDDEEAEEELGGKEAE